MKNNIWHSLGHAVLVLVYVWGVVELVQHLQQTFGPNNKTILVPMVILMLFVLSAAVCGTLVLGRPALLYFNGQKKEALEFFGWTLGWLAILTVIVLVVLVMVR